jgi:SAM-dependent methyltransferase
MYEHIEYETVDVDSHKVIEDSEGMLESYPWRGPAVVPHVMRPYILEKTVCDLGCGGGDLAWLMGRWAHHVTGIEIDHKRHAIATRTRGANGEQLPLRAFTNVSIEKRDYIKGGIPKTDVYYFWPNDPDTIDSLMAFFEEKADRPFIVMAGARPAFLDSEKEGEQFRVGSASRSCRLLKHVDAHDGKVISAPFYEKSSHQGWADEGMWCLCVIPLGGAEL